MPVSMQIRQYGLSSPARRCAAPPTYKALSRCASPGIRMRGTVQPLPCGKTVCVVGKVGASARAQVQGLAVILFDK